MTDDADHGEDLAPDQKSKSQRKREMTALQELGEELVALKPAQLQALALPEMLHAAVAAARTIVQRGARKRQLQYVGRLMREVDAEPIRAALAAIKNPQRQSATAHHDLERWRERLLNEGDAAVQEFVALHAHADRQHLRQLLRNAYAEQAHNKPPRAARLLFQYLREITGAGAA